MFDESKDVVIDSALAVDDNSTRVLVQLCQYNGGATKIQIKRENRSRGDWTFAKLGRMTPAEFEAMVPVGLELMNKHNLH